jgi:hypothetical protein
MGGGAVRRYTSGMKIAVLLSRHRRLLALCGLSACAHLLVLELVAQRAAAPSSAPPAGEALRLRLSPAAPSAPAAAVAPLARTRAAQPTPAGDAHQPPPMPADAPAPSPASAPAEAASEAASEAEGRPLLQMPSRYRVRMPDPVRLSYALSHQAPGAAPAPASASAPASAGDATLDWRSDGEHYTLSVDGVLGRLSSEGGSSDAGIAPRIGKEERGGATLATEFDADGRRILFRASGASVPDAVGAQDRASVLMQLAGIGLAEPDQIRGQVQNELRIVVAGADGAGIARYQVMGLEQVPTALGGVEAWRLAQVVPAGQDRLELWLAPDRGWLPVQIRLIHPDGSAATQTLTRIEPGASR